jgi:hypothetical protein
MMKWFPQYRASSLREKKWKSQHILVVKVPWFLLCALFPTNPSHCIHCIHINLRTSHYINYNLKGPHCPSHYTPINNGTFLLPIFFGGCYTLKLAE